MRIGIDYRILAVGPELINRGLSRYTQQQLRAVLAVDTRNEYVLLCLPGNDLSLVDPDVRRAPNVSIRFFPALSQDDPNVGDPNTFLRRAEEYQRWLRQERIELYHATTPFLVQDPLLVDFDVCPMVATFYDVIPFIYPGQYLTGWWREQYKRTLAFLGRANRLIAISGSARDDAVAYLGYPSERIDVVWPTPDAGFHPLGDEEADAALAGLRRRTALPQRFLLTVSHLHYSKNLNTLLRAFALLPADVRASNPLVVCCHLDDDGVNYLRALADRFGVAEHVLTTGLVSDTELCALYSQAVAVVHPSRYEGFGLPVVEAMRCSAAVITTTASSLPEVAGEAALLVDPDDATGLARAVTRIIDDPQLRQEMGRRGTEQADKFNNEQLAYGTLRSYEAAAATPLAEARKRPRLAVWTPFPNQPSGIADYSVELLAALQKRYEIEVFVDDGCLPPSSLLRQFRVRHFTAFTRRQEQRPFDAYLYQLGGSLFHLYMYETLLSHPGIVVLHDLTWSHVLYTKALELGDMAIFRKQVLEIEGHEAVREWDAIEQLDPAQRAGAIDGFLAKFSMLGTIVGASQAQIVHVEEAADEVTRLFPAAMPVTIPMGVADPYHAAPAVGARAARLRLGVPDDALVIGAFGIVHRFKRLEQCVKAFARLHASHPGARLVIVGRALEDTFVARLRELADALGVSSSIELTGRVSREQLDTYLLASDVVLNLRLPTSLHMSATLVRALAAGKPVVISDLADWRFIPDDACLRVPLDGNELPALVAHLQALATDPDLRKRLSAGARSYYEREATIEAMAGKYIDVLEGHLGTSVPSGMGVGDPPHAAGFGPATHAHPELPLSKPCEIEDFSHPELLPVIRDVCEYKQSQLAANFPTGVEYRKDWEVAMAVRTFSELGVLRPDSTVLGVAAGAEDTTFYLTRRVGRVFATDRYLDSGDWHSVAPLSMLADPQLMAPFEFDRDRLVVQHMDGRSLKYPDDTFDGVFSSSSVEHFGDLQDVANAAYEMGRVLKPGGVLSLSTELRLNGPPGGIGWPGRTLIFSPDHLQRFIIDASGLEPVGEVQLSVSDKTLQTGRDLTLAIDDHDARVSARGEHDQIDEYALWDFPHIVLVQLGYVFTSVHLALRKSDDYPRVPNEWARPVPATIEAIDHYNRDLVHRETASRLETVPPPESPLSWDALVGANRDNVAVLDRGRERLSDQIKHLDAQLSEIERCLDPLDSWHDHARLQRGYASEIRGHVEHWLEELSTRAPADEEVAGTDRSSWQCCSVTLAEGTHFDVMINGETGDHVSGALARGTSLDQHLLSLMLHFVQPGDRVLDLGAHVGTFSLAAAAAGCPALAVEASPENVALLRASAARNSLFNIRVVHAAVGDDISHVDFVPDGPWGRIKTAESTAATVSVPAVTVSELVSELGWLPLAFLKIDVEGSELKAFNGMREVLTRYDAPTVLYECNGHTLAFYGLTPRHILEKMESFGYTSYMVEPGRLIRVRADEFQPQTMVDCIAVKGHLPILPGWEVSEEMSFDERVSRIVADAVHANENHRIWISRALRDSGAILEDPRIGGVMARLRADADERVREAVGWSEEVVTTEAAPR